MADAGEEAFEVEVDHQGPAGVGPGVGQDAPAGEEPVGLGLGGHRGDDVVEDPPLGPRPGSRCAGRSGSASRPTSWGPRSGRNGPRVAASAWKASQRSRGTVRPIASASSAGGGERREARRFQAGQVAPAVAEELSRPPGRGRRYPSRGDGRSPRARSRSRSAASAFFAALIRARSARSASTAAIARQVGAGLDRLVGRSDAVHLLADPVDLGQVLGREEPVGHQRPVDQPGPLVRGRRDPVAAARARGSASAGDRAARAAAARSSRAIGRKSPARRARSSGAARTPGAPGRASGSGPTFPDPGRSAARGSGGWGPRRRGGRGLGGLDDPGGAGPGRGRSPCTTSRAAAGGRGERDGGGPARLRSVDRGRSPSRRG